jgi:NAD-dependent dihydropyrimidine dehydrogenase PreA subunit
MSYVIAEPCVDQMDQACVAVCPADCIGSEPGLDRKLHIDPDACISCGSCQSVCPNGAIFPATAIPADFADYAWIDAAWHRNPGVAREVLVEVLAARAEAEAGR